MRVQAQLLVLHGWVQGLIAKQENCTNSVLLNKDRSAPSNWVCIHIHTHLPTQIFKSIPTVGPTACGRTPSHDMPPTCLFMSTASPHLCRLFALPWRDGSTHHETWRQNGHGKTGTRCSWTKSLFAQKAAFALSHPLVHQVNNARAKTHT